MELMTSNNAPKLTQQEIDQIKVMAAKSNIKLSDELQNALDAYEWTQNKDFKMSRIMTNIEGILTTLARKLYDNCQEIEAAFQTSQVKPA